MGLLVVVVGFVLTLWGSVKFGEALYRQTNVSLPSLARLVSAAIFVFGFILACGGSGDTLYILAWPVFTAGTFYTLFRVGIRRHPSERTYASGISRLHAGMRSTRRFIFRR
ncbi:MAG: hypothetical protein ACO1SV_19355 [Fimbriimonas sp.]